MESYFRSLEAEVDRAYLVAEEARKVGLDPATVPEIPRAQDMAMRVEKLLGHLHLDGISEEIRTLARDHPREEVAVLIARRLAADARRGESVEARLDAALRVGLAILTEGILVAPLEGLAEVHLRENRSGPPYIELYYAGPIRAAGGTAQALSVLLADIVRRDLGLGVYHPEGSEVERYQEEIPLYKHLQHLQYVPSAAEIATVVRHVPVCITGETTEGDNEVSAFRNLPRVGTNGVRGGACLVIAEGLCQKSAKLRNVVEKLGLPGWEFLSELGHAKSAENDGARGPKYLAEAVGGRPILAHPHRPGGFRLTYGRARTAGLASCAVSPATMVILRRFVAIGTQVKLEFPGKASAMAVCDEIEGPIVELNDGSVTAVHDAARAEELLPLVRRIIDLGELLVPFGEFLENNRALSPGTYSVDWHLEELRAAGAEPDGTDLTPTYAEAIDSSMRWGVPLHPRFLLFWHDLTPPELRALGGLLDAGAHVVDGRLELTVDGDTRELLVRLGFLFAAGVDGTILGEEESTAALIGGLGLEVDGATLRRVRPLEPVDDESLQYVSRLAGVPVVARAPSRIGARVGRPEKARQRMMSPNVHGLFPVGEAGGPHRSVAEAARRSGTTGISVQLGRRTCPKCEKATVWLRCGCGSHTEPTGEVGPHPLRVAELWTEALSHLPVRRGLEVKGVKGLTSPGKTPELLEKGILRASRGISVYQDGTARFDLTDLPLTHFRPREIGLSIPRAHDFGYTTDWDGAPLTSPEQLVELRPQDLVVSRSCGEYLLALSQFVDDELIHLYGLTPFYRAGRVDDLLGAIVVALAPHTSGGVAGRIIGFTEAEACFAHPVFHAAKRRNCDGDEDSVTLLLDSLLNFSRAYLPQSRGALMDKPLVLTTRLDVTEVDKEAHNLDVVDHYPLALFHAARDGRSPKDVAALIETLGRRIGEPVPLAGLAFTHDTSSIAGGPVRSAYREAGSMHKGVELSIMLAGQIRAVDVVDAVTLVLNHHFLPDLMGNLKSYATQKFRCKKCNASYRRPPLSQRCTAPAGRGEVCDGELLPTVFEGAVRKYLGLSQRLAGTPGVTPYLRQRIELLETSLATMFPGSPSQTTLETYSPATPRRAERRTASESPVVAAPLPQPPNT
ncbi:MAG: DNA polymerase II large subunit [Thermoplasmata archaeon]|nr:DNA polymerase II large subunit [Thermoplasmata archaeon]